MNARKATLGIALTAALAAPTAPAGAMILGQPGNFAVSAQVPRANGALPLFRLSRSAAPTSLVESIVHGSGGPSLRPEGSRLVARDGAGLVRGYSDPNRGEAQIFPDLTAPAGYVDGTAMARTEAAVFSRGDIIPHDATTIRMGAPNVVGSVDATAPQAGQPASVGRPQQLFTYVSAQRLAAGLPVYGIGSKATVGIGPDGSVRALVRRWQVARQAGTVSPALSQAQVLAEIRGQLSRYLAQGDAVNVKAIELGYYDGDASYLQPIYFFSAEIRSGAGRDEIAGYVPFGKQVEPIVSLAAAPAAAQSMPSGAVGNGNAGGGANGNISQITEGDYANDDGQTVSQGNALLAGFQTYSPGIYGPAINRTQYLWSAPAAYIGSSAQSYINAVEVAHTPPHGDWYVNTTNGTGGGAFFFNNIGTGGNPGYGHASGNGKLATWILDSCENAPSYYDMQVTTGNGNNAFNIWWPIFQGLHHVLAYRTMMYINQTPFDQQFGQDAQMGTNIGSAWYNDNASWYSQYGGTYLDTHLNQQVHMGRVSIFQDKRNLNESIYSVQGQSAAGSMNNSWMNN